MQFDNFLFNQIPNSPFLHHFLAAGSARPTLLFLCRFCAASFEAMPIMESASIRPAFHRPDSNAPSTLCTALAPIAQCPFRATSLATFAHINLRTDGGVDSINSSNFLLPSFSHRSFRMPTILVRHFSMTLFLPLATTFRTKNFPLLFANSTTHRTICPFSGQPSAMMENGI